MSIPPPQALREFVGEWDIYGRSWDKMYSWVVLRYPFLTSASHPQAEKYEENIPQNNGELAVRAKLVLPEGPRKPQEAQEGWLPPAP